MEDRQESQERRSLLPVVVLALLPVLYLASVGPMYGLYMKDVISDSTWETVCRTVYLPIVYLDDETEFFETPVGEVYGWYIEQFEP